MRRVGDLMTLTNGYPFDSEAFGPDGDTPLVRIRDLRAEEFSTFVSGRIPSEVVLSNGDIVIGMDGDFDVVVWSRGRAALNQRLCLLRPRPGTDARFVAYALSRLLALANDLTYGTTVKHLSSFDVLRERMPCPAHSVQRSISDYLDAETTRMDMLLAGRRRMVELLAQRTDELASVALDRPDWPLVPLKWLAQVTVGIVIRPSEVYVDTGAPCLRSFNVLPGEVIDRDLAHISEEANVANAKSRLCAGDVVVVRTGNAGAAAVVPAWADGGNCVDLLIIRRTPRLLPRFLETVLNSAVIRRQIADQSVGALQAHFNTESLAGLRVPAPRIEEQHSTLGTIDRQLEHVRALRALQVRQIDLLVERRQALITAAVTGQIEISGVAA
jgi:type I restriction enzyme S subunit